MERPCWVNDLRVRRYIWPARVLGKTEGVQAEGLLAPDGAPCVMHGGDSILLDFGRELHGGIQLENGITKAHAPTRVRIRFGESASEAMGEPNNDHAIHDFSCDVPWYGYAETGNTGFRFVHIELPPSSPELILKQARAVFLYRDIPYRGAFSCNDERLNLIWATGAYTVQLCMQDMLWDGIKRDRLVWLGDMHPETTVIGTVFGEHDIVPRSLDFVRDRTPLPQWMNGISSYSLWWLIIQHDWYAAHGNRAYLDEQRTYFEELTRHLLTQIADNGSEHLGATRFLDWPSSEDPAAIHAGLHALLRIAFRSADTLCDTLGLAALQADVRHAVQRLAAYVPPPTASKEANALLVLSDMADARETNARVLAQNPLQGLSTFYGYYVLQARAKAGDYAGCLEAIRRYWGAMIDMGATTFWEDFNLAWIDNAFGIDSLPVPGKKDIHADFGNYCYKGLRHSLCHGWASGPTAWLSEHVLGCTRATPGGLRVHIDPHLGDLEWAHGTFPTSHGDVRVEHTRRSDGRVATTVDAPDKVEVTLAPGVVAMS